MLSLFRATHASSNKCVKCRSLSSKVPLIPNDKCGVRKQLLKKFHHFDRVFNLLVACSNLLVSVTPICIPFTSFSRAREFHQPEFVCLFREWKCRLLHAKWRCIDRILNELQFNFKHYRNSTGLFSFNQIGRMGSFSTGSKRRRWNYVLVWLVLG